MRYRKLGRWDVNISVVGLASWLTNDGAVESAAARDCIVRAFERGINVFDTANVYVRGCAEEVVGRAIRAIPARRHRARNESLLSKGLGSERSRCVA
jgi:aryl-alcohol dehydrogenase-like predicted oxidoreductase